MWKSLVATWTWTVMGFIELTQALIPIKGLLPLGTSHNEYAGYTEDGSVNVRVMERLLKIQHRKDISSQAGLVSCLNHPPWGWFILGLRILPYQSNELT